VNGHQAAPAIAMNRAGGFVVVWSDDRSYSARARLFDAAGDPAGDDFHAAKRATLATVGMDGAGDFVVASTGGFDYGLYTRRFSRSGQPAGDDVSISRRHATFDLASSRDGEFVVAWNDYDGNVYTHRGDDVAGGRGRSEVARDPAPAAERRWSPSTALAATR
jgi:hypothetical protein